MPLFPVFLDLFEQRVLVVGAGSVGSRRARGLLAAGARVTIVAPEIRPDLRGLAVTLIERPFAASDLDGARLAFACTDDAALNDEIVSEAARRGVWCGSATRPERASLRLGASLTRGSVLVSVQTGADLPYLSLALRDKIEAALPGELPVEAWTARRRAALARPEAQRIELLAALKSEIEQAVGL